MPFKLDEFRAKLQFVTSRQMPTLIYEACKATGVVSGTVYCQHALCEALSRDLGIPIADLLAQLPAPRGPGKHLFDPADQKMVRPKPITEDHTGGTVRIGPANTHEEVQ